MLDYLLKKDKPFTYIDTHAGAGMFNLQAQHAKKLQEHHGGINKLYNTQVQEFKRFMDSLKKINANNESALKRYPGSPLIALNMLRPVDKAHLFELHPSDFAQLRRNTEAYRHCKVYHQDGLKGLLAQLPPPSRRGLALIDPSYEIKTDYHTVVQALIAAYKKFPTGTYALWYPVVDRKNIDLIERQLQKSPIKHIQRFELAVTEDTPGQGMTASGMIVINPTWGLHATMSSVLPKLVALLGENNTAFYTCDILANE